VSELIIIFHFGMAIHHLEAIVYDYSDFVFRYLTG